MIFFFRFACRLHSMVGAARWKDILEIITSNISFHLSTGFPGNISLLVCQTKILCLLCPLSHTWCRHVVPDFPFLILFGKHDRWFRLTKAWRFLRLRMKGRPPIWRVATKILNKQSLTADKGRYSSLGDGLGVKNS